MKKISKLSFITCLAIIIFSSSIYAQAKRKANEDTRTWRYEIEVVGTGVQGTYLIKVWSYSKKPTVAIEQAKKNAIHGVVFQGFVGKAGVDGKPPLVTDANAELDKADFFNTFFDDRGEYMKYVTLTNDGAVAADDRLKIGKEYKIAVIVSVNVASLRKALEDAGIIKPLNSGF